MLPNRGPWPTFPPQNLQYPYYYPGGYYPTYNSANYVPPSAPYASGPNSSPVTPSTPYASGPSSSPISPLAATTTQFRPTGMASPAPVTPSPGFPLPMRSPTIKISSPSMVNASGAASVGVSSQPECPLTKKERKMKAKLEAEEKKRAEAAKTAQKGAEEAERLRKAEVDERKREEDEVKTLEEELRKLEEEMMKEEEQLKRREEERRKAEEDLRKLEEEHQIHQDKNERARKEREEAEAKAKAEETQRHILVEKTNAGSQANGQEKEIPGGSNLDGLGFKRPDEIHKIKDPSARASRAQARRLGLAFAPSAFTNKGFDTPPEKQDSFITRETQEDQQWYEDDFVEDQKTPGEPPAGSASYHTLNAILELSKQMEMLLQEMKDLKDEVRELRSEARIGDGGERIKSPKRETSVPEAPKTATAINQYFIMKKGELDFSPGDVITILDAPQDTPRGWMYGEINVTKRGFFPASYVKLRQ